MNTAEINAALMNNYLKELRIMTCGICSPLVATKTYPFFNKASVCGRRAEEVSTGEETAGTEPQRNAAAEPQTEARR